MKKILAILLTAVLLLSSMTLIVYAETDDITAVGAEEELSSTGIVSPERLKVVDYMHKMATIEWQCSKNFQGKWGNDVCDRYYAGYTYFGIPYSIEANGGASLVTYAMFKEKVDAGKITTCPGRNDCSGAVGLSMKQVDNSVVTGGTSDMYPNSNGYIAVGSYTNRNSKAETCSYNGETKMFNAYKLLKPGDCVVRDGHAMLVVENNSNSKKIKVIHQSSGDYKYDPKADSTAYVSVDLHKPPRNCSWGVNQTFEYSTLFSSGYIPLTCKALAESDKKEYVDLGEKFYANIVATATGTAGTAAANTDEIELSATGAGAYTSIPALKISRVVQSGDRECFWCSMLTTVGYATGSFSYNNYTTDYRIAGKDYSSYNDALSQKFKSRSSSSFADDDLSIFPVKIAKKTNSVKAKGSSYYDSNLGNNSYTYNFIYEQLSQGRPVAVYATGASNHASVIIGYKENSSKTLAATGFVVLEVKKQGNWWSNSVDLYSKYANNPQVDSASGSTMSCYVNLDSWLKYEGSNKKILTICYPTEIKNAQVYENLGDTFYANIAPTGAASLAVTANDSGNVELGTLNYADNQKWLFERDADNSYKITNVKLSKCMDVDGGKTENKTNIKVYTSNNSNAQRFYIVKNGSGYRLVPKILISGTLDIAGGTLSAGTNIQLWTNQNDSDAQRFSINKTANCIDIGTSFTANIINTSSGLEVAANAGGNALVKKPDGSDYQLWYFEQQSDRSYKITNKALNKCLDVYDRNIANGTNIQVYNDNNTVAQRWYVVQNGTDFNLVPKINPDAALDIQGGTMSDGTNLQEYKNNSSAAQKFYFSIVDAVPSATKKQGSHIYEYYSLNTSWYQAYRFCERMGGHLVTISSADENTLIYSMINSRIWIGSLDIGKTKSWYWCNGEAMSYTNYAEGQPDSYNNAEHFMSMYKDGANAGKWNDLPQTSLSCFVCEYDDIVSADGYTPVTTGAYGEKRYEVYDCSVDWQTAMSICQKKGGSLACINSAELNSFIGQLISNGTKDEYWIDATDGSREGIWTDHLGNKLTYVNWSNGEPNNSVTCEEYAHIVSSTGKCNDSKGFSAYYRSVGFICEYNSTDDPTLPSEITIMENETVMKVNDTMQMLVAIYPENALDTITWKSSDPSVATVSNSGLVTAVSEGTVRITGTTVNGLEAYCDITVESYYEPPTPSNAILGDVDGDGEVMVTDATYIQRKLAEIDIPFELIDAVADTDGNGQVTLMDVTYIQRWLAHLKSNDNIGKLIET